MISDFATRFGTAHVGKGFLGVKHDGREYEGQIVKVGAYTKGTLVTIKWYDPKDTDTPNYRSVYLEDCKVWYTEEPSPYQGG